MSDDFVSKAYVSTDKSKLDVKLIHKFLSEESYWSRNIPFEIVKKSIDNSLCFGIYLDEKQVGFARAVTDYATYAYLADVFILPEYRREGLSKKLLSEIVNYKDLQGLRRMALATAEAGKLYEQFGFKAAPKPDILMEIYRPDIYHSDSI